MNSFDFSGRALVAAANCHRNGHVLVGLMTTATPHLLVVIAVRSEIGHFTGTYTTWVMNTTQDEHECLNLGHYFLPTLAAAYADALDREHF